MANYLRNNAWNNNGDFSNLDLLWYAKGVGAMMSRALNDPAGWWFYAAIHGEYVNPKTAWYPGPVFPGWEFIKSPPSCTHLAPARQSHPEAVLESVSARQLVFFSVAPWLSDGA